MVLRTISYCIELFSISKQGTCYVFAYTFYFVLCLFFPYISIDFFITFILGVPNMYPQVLLNLFFFSIFVVAFNKAGVIKQINIPFSSSEQYYKLMKCPHNFHNIYKAWVHHLYYCISFVNGVSFTKHIDLKRVGYHFVSFAHGTLNYIYWLHSDRMKLSYLSLYTDVSFLLACSAGINSVI